jgi:hypothetical protein
VLIALRLLEQSYARELSRFLRLPVSVVQKAVRSLERDDLIAGRLFGKTRVLQLNPRYFAAAEVRALLDRFVEADTDLRSRLAQSEEDPEELESGFSDAGASSELLRPRRSLRLLAISRAFSSAAC